MRELNVFIEIDGESRPVGVIRGQNSSDAYFSYTDSYLQDVDACPISISLPLNEKTFDVTRTRNFFEGLLPEGFTRRCVAESMHMDENDYVSILASLGRECLGALEILDAADDAIEPQYKRLTDREVYDLACEGATESVELVTKSHLSLTGASGKVGLYYNEEHQQWYLPIGTAASTYIVKQSHVRLKRIVANEQLCLLTAKHLGIEVPESFIVTTASMDEEAILFATKRYDRKFGQTNRVLNGMKVPYRLHQEDFAQALGIPAANKYEKNNEGYLKKAFKVVRTYSSEPIIDSLKLWDICVFNYLIGNTDNHIKNLSLIYGEDLRNIRLAPAYDIVSTLIYESSTENMAMSINGKYNIYELSRTDFEEEAANVGLGRKFAMERFDNMVNHFLEAMAAAKKELELQGFDKIEQICERILEKGGIRKEKI